MSELKLDITKLVVRRTKALASIFLTTPPSLEDQGSTDLVQVFEVEHDLGIDMLARIDTQNGDQVLMFGVIVTGTTEPLRTKAEATDWLNDLSASLDPIRSFPFPVVEILFSMVGDRGYFAWRTEPVVGIHGNINLAGRPLARCEEIGGRASLDAIITRVVGWYESLERKVVA